MLDPKARLAIYAEGAFGKSSKTAEGILRYAKNPVAAVIDSTCAGRSVHSVVGINSPAPIVSTIKESLAFQPDALLLGTAWSGGKLPAPWRQAIKEAIIAGMDVVNGLHDFLAEDPEFAQLAKKHKRRLWDVRRPPDELPVGNGKCLKAKGFIVLTVGTDCSVGKMTVSLELVREADKRGIKSNFVATGQTGMMIAGSGIAIDRVIGDFMSGATEEIVLAADNGCDLIVVEGQGTLGHPGFSGVSLAILHGSCPQAMIMVHNPSRTEMKSTGFPLIDINEMIRFTEETASLMRTAKVVGVALNTSALSDAEARKVIEQTERLTGLPSNDAVRFGAGNLLDAILTYKEKQRDPNKVAANRH